MTYDELVAELRRKSIVCENLAARLGALTAENIDLLVRVHDLEAAAGETRPALVDLAGNGHVAEPVST